MHILKGAPMLYPDWAFVKSPLVVWCLGASVSILPYPIPPVSRGQLPHPRPEQLTHCKRPNPSAALSTSRQTTAAADTSHQEDQMALGRLEPNTAPSSQPRPQRLLTSRGSCLVPLQPASTPASLSFENHLGKF